MGVFISRRVDPKPVEDQLTTAFMTEPPADPEQARTRAQDLATSTARSAAAGTVEFHTGRFIFAVVLFGSLLGLAVLADALNWVDDAGKLYDLATTVLGLVVGFLGGEASSA